LVDNDDFADDDEEEEEEEQSEDLLDNYSAVATAPKRQNLAAAVLLPAANAVVRSGAGLSGSNPSCTGQASDEFLYTAQVCQYNVEAKAKKATGKKTRTLADLLNI
jgi:hypothetical protein